MLMWFDYVTENINRMFGKSFEGVLVYPLKETCEPRKLHFQ